MIKKVRKKLLSWLHDGIVHVINSVDGEFEWERKKGVPVAPPSVVRSNDAAP